MTEKYQHHREKTFELFRLAVAQMSQQQAGLHPLAYTLWYDFVAGINQPLQNAVAAALSEHGKLDEALTLALYQKYIVDATALTVQRSSHDLQQMLHHSEQFAQQTTARYGLIGQQIRDTQFKLQTHQQPDQLQALFLGLYQHSDELCALTSQMVQQLHEQQKEINNLRNELTQATQISLHDNLTGLYNEAGLETLLEDLLSFDDHTHSLLTLVMINIDGFTQLNEQYGHLFGDKVLRTIAQALRVALSKGTTSMARMMADNFAVIMPSISVVQAFALCEQLRNAVMNSHIRRSGKDNAIERVSGITISAGIAASQMGDSAVNLIERSRAALLDAKQKGKNQVLIAEPITQTGRANESAQAISAMRLAVFGDVKKIEDI
ncbi:GGDEF domain-containing protein [Ampullimonas aquatilis]|uniref:GGDEF domain-containing protein n=1 Tax=Ampullimonas aquatilis TaxID=1341549 RepID=UPI003C74FC34